MHVRQTLLAMLGGALAAVQAHAAAVNLGQSSADLGLLGHLHTKRLVARQAATGSDDSSMPARCESDCTAFNTIATQCDSGSETAQYSCVCNTKTFDALIQCGHCAPDYYDIYDGGLKGFVENAISECRGVGHAVTVDTASLPGGSSSSSLPDTDSSSSASSVRSTSAIVSTTARTTSSRATTTPSVSVGARPVAANVATTASTGTGSRMGPVNDTTGTANRIILVRTGVLCLSAAIIAVLIQSQL